MDLLQRDPFSGEARRIDFAVIKDGRVQELHEVTNQTADKTTQSLKELNIRNNGGTYIRDRESGKLIDVSNTKTNLNRKD